MQHICMYWKFDHGEQENRDDEEEEEEEELLIQHYELGLGK